MKLEKDFLDAISENKKEKTKPYDTTATVVREDGDIVWVHIDGGVDETPVSRTLNAKKNDKVRVRISGGSAYLIGNTTSPPTDDTVAENVKVIASTANDSAIRAYDKASDAEHAANDVGFEVARHAEEISKMQEDSVTAKEAIDRIDKAAAEAEAKALDATTKSDAATQAAEDVKTNLGPVAEDVSTLKQHEKSYVDSFVGLQESVSAHYSEQEDTAKLVSDHSTSIKQNADAIESTSTSVYALTTDIDTAKKNAESATTLAQSSQESADAAKLAADNAKKAADDALKTAGGNNKTFHQPDSPSTAGEGDLWVDSDNGNKLFRFESGVWNEIRDAGITTAYDNAGKALNDSATANTAASNAQKAADTANANVTELSGRVATSETSIKQNSESIALCATKQEVSNDHYTKLESDSKIESSATAIESKVSSTYSTIQYTDSKASELDGKISETNETIVKKDSEFKQTSNDLTVKFNSVSDALNTISAWLRTGVDSSNTPFLELGQSNSEVTTKLTNGELAFYSGGVKVAYVSKQKLYISVAQVTATLEIDHLDNGARTNGWEFTTRKNGNLILRTV